MFLELRFFKWQRILILLVPVFGPFFNGVASFINNLNYLNRIHANRRRVWNVFIVIALYLVEVSFTMTVFYCSELFNGAMELYALCLVLSLYPGGIIAMVAEWINMKRYDAVTGYNELTCFPSEQEESSPED